MVPVTYLPFDSTKLTVRICGIDFSSSSGSFFTSEGASAVFEPFGHIRTSPCASASLPDFSSKMIEPERPVSALLYSPDHLPTSAERSAFVAASTGMTGDGFAGPEQAAESAAAASPAAEIQPRFLISPPLMVPPGILTQESGAT